MTNATASASDPQAVEGSPLPGPCAPLATEPADEQDLRALLQRVLESGMQMAAAQAGVVRVLSAAGDCLQMVGQCGLPEPVARAEQSIAVPLGAAGRARPAIRSRGSTTSCAARTPAGTVPAGMTALASWPCC